MSDEVPVDVAICTGCAMPILTRHTGLCELAGGLHAWGPVLHQDTARVGRRAAQTLRRNRHTVELAVVLGAIA